MKNYKGYTNKYNMYSMREKIYLYMYNIHTNIFTLYYITQYLNIIKV